MPWLIQSVNLSLHQKLSKTITRFNNESVANKPHSHLTGIWMFYEDIVNYL